MRLIDADALMENYGLKDATKYGNKDAEQQEHSYSTLMLYEIADIIEDAPTVEAKPVEWIPCSERLPNCNGCYLVWRPHFFGGQIGMPAICYFDGQDTWHDSYGVDFTRILNEKDVIAWMPLPTPYNAERGGKNE